MKKTDLEEAVDALLEDEPVSRYAAFQLLKEKGYDNLDDIYYEASAEYERRTGRVLG